MKIELECQLAVPGPSSVAEKVEVVSVGKVGRLEENRKKSYKEIETALAARDPLLPRTTVYFIFT